MPLLLLSEDDVRKLVNMGEAIAAVDEGLRAIALDEGQNIPRSRCQTDQAMLHVLSASAKPLQALGYKAYCTTKAGAHFHVGLFDGTTGQLAALIQADYLGQLRTGAASGLATNALARPDAAILGVYGIGKQARTQVQAVCRVRNISRVWVMGRDQLRTHQFCCEIYNTCGVAAEGVDHPRQAAEQMDIIITATNSRDPVLIGDWLSPGCHINAIGSNFRAKTEIDINVVKRANRIVVDSKEQAKLEAGDLIPAVDAGVAHWADMAELGAVLVGRSKGRESPRDITLFKSLGLGIEDVALANFIVKKAKAAGVGRMVEW